MFAASLTELGLPAAKAGSDETSTIGFAPPWMVGLPDWVGLSGRGADPASGVQFYLGGKGSGAQPHTHEHAWNLAVHGAKRWLIWPPVSAFYSATPAADFAARALPVLRSNEDRPLECVQRSGDLLCLLRPDPHIETSPEVEST